jgi:hypothetical protein
MTMLLLTRRSLSSSSWPKIDYWSGTAILFPRFGSEWLVAVFKVKSALRDENFKTLNISKRNWRQHWKLYNKRSCKMFTMAASFG